MTDTSPINGTPLPNETLVFVYGRLRRGEADHRFLAGARYVGETHTVSNFTLVDLGGLPGLVAGGDSAVHGEVWAVSPATLAMIDELEDHPETFRRTRIELADGSFAQSYLIPSGQACRFPRLADGCWQRRA